VAEPVTSSSEGIVHYLLTDPLIMGSVSWIGFAVTILGIGIAIWQSRQAQNAAQAASNAAQAASNAVGTLTRAIHSRERLLELGNATRHLDNAGNHITQLDFSKAVIFLQLARSECVLVRELLEDEHELSVEVGDILILVTKLITALTLDESKGRQEDVSVQRALAVRDIENRVTDAAARLRFRFAEVQINNGQ
jgi:hypothetical protein